MANYKPIGVPFDRTFRNDLNANFNTIDAVAADAQVKAVKAEADASKAVVDSTTAKTTAENVQAQFNQVVIDGDSSVEAAQARVDKDGVAFTTLKERIDSDQTKLAQKASVVQPENFGAKGDTVYSTGIGTDDTVAIRSAITYAIANKLPLYFSPLKVYKVYEGSAITGGDKSYSTRGIFDLVNVKGLKIIGNHAKIYDARTRGSIGSTATGVFFLKGCSDITFEDLDYYMAPQALNFNDLQYRGGTFIKLHGDNDNIKIDTIVENARYGVKSGEFNVHNFAEINDANGSKGGLINSKIRIKATNTGYPVAIEFGKNLDVEINCEQVHRMGYFCGTSDSRIRALGRSDYATHALVLIKDGRYYDNTNTLFYRGCKNVDVYVRDTGSTIDALSPSGLTQLFTVECYTPDLVPRTTPITFESIKCTGKIDLNSQAVGSWLAIDSTVTTSDIYRNITFSVIDDSGGNSGSFNSRLLRFVNLNGTNCKVENIKLKDVYTTKDIYFGSKIAAKFELDNVNANILYYDNTTLAGANGNEKIYIRDSVFSSITTTSSSYSIPGSLFLEYIQANIQLTHLNLFSSFHVETRARKRGSSSQRPFINTNLLAKERCMVGVPFTYYDTDLGRTIMVSNITNKWVNLDGTSNFSGGNGINITSGATSYSSPGLNEDDANYKVLVAPTWNTTWWITNKTTTGFTINFGTAPSSNSTLDWSIRR